MSAALTLTRQQIIARRLEAGGLGTRVAHTRASVRRAAWAGLQDSMPRAALLSLHARVRDVGPNALDDPALIQLWGPRHSCYAVAAEDHAVFTLGRLPTDARGRERAYRLAAGLATMGARGITDAGQVGIELGGHPNAIRYAAATGTVLIRWDGARAPEIWSVPAPEMEEAEARRELVRRYLHVFGPGTAASFATWAGVSARAAAAGFAALSEELQVVSTPLGAAQILAADEAALRGDHAPLRGVRLLPSGDAFFLLQGGDRELLVPDPACRAQLWPSRVWPGALLVDGEVAGTWRRAEEVIRIQAWGRLSDDVREAVEAEAEMLPVPVDRQLRTLWE